VPRREGPRPDPDAGDRPDPDAGYVAGRLLLDLCGAYLGCREKFGLLLRAVRLARGLTVDALAAELGTSGQTVVNLEKGLPPGPETVRRVLAWLTGVTVPDPPAGE
jgi:DNA-binding XRE family transcriptional regulator